MAKRRGNVKVTLTRSVPASRAAQVKARARSLGWQVKTSKTSRKRRRPQTFASTFGF